MNIEITLSSFFEFTNIFLGINPKWKYFLKGKNQYVQICSAQLLRAMVNLEYAQNVHWRNGWLRHNSSLWITSVLNRVIKYISLRKNTSKYFSLNYWSWLYPSWCLTCWTEI